MLSVTSVPQLYMKFFRHIATYTDPIIGSDGYYLPFNDIFRSQTSEMDRPSLQAQKQEKLLSYTSVKQHADNMLVLSFNV